MSIDENVDALLRLLPEMEKSLGPDHPDLADYLISLGLLLYHDSRFDEAEDLFKRALDMRERLLAVDHPDVAAALNHLGLVYLAQALCRC
ncbi:MAG: tetratricopeptide repeat protein [Candidatus Obscuribacter sp.]|nr:tetratricopeptide repeat protein [Candidatus Obscuribacter sp.]